MIGKYDYFSFELILITKGFDLILLQYLKVSTA